MRDSDRLNIKERWKQWARRLRFQVLSLYYACKDPRMPWYASLFIVIIVGYAFSPIDLIPDFVPILGYLDDFLLLPLGVALAIRMIPSAVMEEAVAKAASSAEKPESLAAAAVIIILWLFVLLWMVSIII